VAAVEAGEVVEGDLVHRAADVAAPVAALNERLGLGVQRQK